MVTYTKYECRSTQNMNRGLCQLAGTGLQSKQLGAKSRDCREKPYLTALWEATIWSMTCSTPRSSLLGATRFAWRRISGTALAIM